MASEFHISRRSFVETDSAMLTRDSGKASTIATVEDRSIGFHALPQNGKPYTVVKVG
jgi:hypothetical protein